MPQALGSTGPRAYGLWIRCQGRRFQELGLRAQDWRLGSRPQALSSVASSNIRSSTYMYALRKP